MKHSPCQRKACDPWRRCGETHTQGVGVENLVQLVENASVGRPFELLSRPQDRLKEEEGDVLRLGVVRPADNEHFRRGFRHFGRFRLSNGASEPAASKSFDSIVKVSGRRGLKIGHYFQAEEISRIIGNGTIWS